MRDDNDDLKDVNDNIEEGNTDSFLKIEPIKGLDISNIKIEIPETEIKKEPETPKKQTNKAEPQPEEPKEPKEQEEEEPKKTKDISKIIKIGIIALIVLLCLGGGYFAYSKFMAKDDNTATTEEVVEETNSLAALEIPNVEPVTVPTPENIEETVQEINESINNQEVEPIIEEVIAEEKENENDDYDLAVLDKVYDEVINKGNEGYLYNFSSDELAIIRNTLYARRGYKFKKKVYQKYFGAKSWYNPRTNSQNILTKKEEKLANIIKRYE